MRRPNGTREWLGDLYDRYAAAMFRYAVMILADRETLPGDDDRQLPQPGQRPTPPVDLGMRVQRSSLIPNP